MSGYCKCGTYHEEDDDRLCGRCQQDAEITRLRAELAEAKGHAKVLAEAMTDDVLEKHPGGDRREWGHTCSTWLYPDETIVQVRHTDDVKAALKWAKEQDIKTMSVGDALIAGLTEFRDRLKKEQP